MCNTNYLNVQACRLVLDILPGLEVRLDLAFNNVKPKDWYFVLDLVLFRTGLGYERLIM